MNKRLLSLLSLSLTATILATPTTVQAQNHTSPPLNIELVGTGKALQFQQAARLESVLKHAQEQQIALQYPLAVTLFDDSESAVQRSTALKNSVLNQMIQHNLVAHPFYKFIQRSQFAPRVLSAIDIDHIRLDKFDNPLLQGQLALSAPKREEKVLYVGNLEKVYAVENQTGVALHEQIDNLRSSDIDELSYPPILIYPDGKVIHPHHGSWLTTQYYLPPLTIVYIPFDEFEKSQMDKDIVALLAQRKPTSSKN
ncbi:YjbG polysaccharide synthesis-related protein [Vibrio parahaemolyticus]|uniref:capsule biosynthesis GfcC family protein n=1 Tax=Vibrio harveyi group TaxID=717610 RepID=UPI00111CC3D7|nr:MULTISPECIES: capsule biosynthesis GfcC family protein [Vibrio harveyi group]EGR3360817.1 YjbG polysaccharide synthesis-related protein [Vibrio parahaemolyticus]ELP3325879.1 capsule biosynthesis GfcC family protein [Vibrio alginolyticus]MBS9914488.1 capsule biosynthesis GfcC family protein [Vibrio alginolyticus]TPA92175.1 YjbG polysaccharide synthesis-related protein [Vibrio parahaemolyticus]HCE2422535.1 capsule biosynthesis GfcC family protein [Vibrio parahaemolyticus]